VTTDRWLAAFALAYGTLHHIGSALTPLGEVGETGTSWADWADLVTPFAVLGCAAGALHAAGASGRIWLLAGAGGVLYAQGHGIHLAANSIANRAPGPTAHLWDEPVGHHLWYAGLALALAALAAACARRPRPRARSAYLLAALVGITHATNSLEGGTALFGMLVAAAFAGWGWRRRGELGRVLLVAYGLALVGLAGYGVWQRGFPQPSSLQWW